MGNLARGPGFGQLSRTRFGADAIGPFVKEPMSPMSAVYPLHLQREIDRRWLRRSEETASVRARLKEMRDLLREAAVAPEDCYAAGPLPASSAKRSTTLTR